MKRVQPGIKDIKNQRRVKCKICEEIFDITADDIKKEKGIRRYYTTCPNPSCKANIQLNEGTIPRSMLLKVDLREI